MDSPREKFFACPAFPLKQDIGFAPSKTSDQGDGFPDRSGRADDRREGIAVCGGMGRLAAFHDDEAAESAALVIFDRMERALACAELGYVYFSIGQGLARFQRFLYLGLVAEEAVE